MPCGPSSGASRWLHTAAVGVRGSGEQSVNTPAPCNAAAAKTYTGEGVSTVAALGRRRGLFEVVVDEDAAGGLDDAAAVGGGVVRLALAERDALGHGDCGRS